MRGNSYRVGLLVVSAVMLLLAGTAEAAKVKLTVLSPYGAGNWQTAFEEIARRFEKQNPQISVKVIPGDWSIVDKLIVQAAAGTGPDIAIITESYVGKLSYSGLLESLDSYIARFKFPMDKYYKAPMDGYQYKYKGKRGQYGFPFVFSGYGYCYNKEIFAKRGLTTPPDDWTMDKFKEYVLKLTLDTNSDGKPDQLALDMQHHQNRYIHFIRSFGGELVDEMRDEYVLDTPQAAEGLQFYGDLTAKYRTVSTSIFPSGKAAMYMSSAFAIQEMRKSKFDWDAVACAIGPRGQRSVAMPTAGVSIPRTSKHKAEAWKLVEYFMSKDAQEYLARLQLAIPVHQQASKTFLNADMKPKNQEMWLEAAKYARATGVAPYCNDVFTSLTSALGSRLLAGKADAVQTIKSVNAEMLSIMKRYKARIDR